MPDRKVIMVEDEEGVPVINEVLTLASHVEEVIHSDAFNQPASELKTFEGTSPVFKRRVTNELKKVRRGIDGAESKQVIDETFLSGYDAFDVEEPPYNMDYLAKLYEISAPHYAAVNAKVANIVGLGYKLTENAKIRRGFEKIADDQDKTKKLRRRLDVEREEVTDKIENLNEEDTFIEVLTKVWRDYEVTGNGYIEVGRTLDGGVGYFGHIPAQTLRIRRKRDGYVQVSGFEVQFFANYGSGFNEETGEFEGVENPIGNDIPNEVIHIKKYTPTNDYYGISDIISAIQAITGNEFAGRFNIDYFENKAVPRHLITLKGATLGGQAQKSILSLFETGIKGQNHRSVFVPLPPDTAEGKVELKIEAVEAEVQDSSFTNYRKTNLSDILMAHRVPVSKVSTSEGASLAIARDADKTFKEQVCSPEQDRLAKKLKQLISEFTEAFDLEFKQMTLTDENTQSQIDERRRKTGVETANEQRIRRGEPAIEGGDELFDMNAQLKLGMEAQKTARRGQDKSEAQAKAANEAKADAAAQAPASAGANPNGNPAGTEQRDTARSAGATDSAGEGRNPQGEGRTTS